MNIPETQDEIKKELKINPKGLDFDSSENPLFIQKYINMYLLESKELNKKQADFDKLYKEKMIYYKADFKYIPDNLKEHIIFVEGDEQIIKAKKDLMDQASNVKFLGDTISNFRDRGWAIKNMIDFRKFMAGE
jgi:hypothetical protein